MFKLSSFKHRDWIIYYSGGKWSPLGFSSWSAIYTRRPFCPEFDAFVDQAIMIWDGSVTTCYIRESQKQRFGLRVAVRVRQDRKFVDNLTKEFVKYTDKVLAFYKKYLYKEITSQQYAAYRELLAEKYYPLHIQIKNVVDFLPPELLQTHLAQLQEVRVHAEPVFSQEVEFMRGFAAIEAKKCGYTSEQILSSFVEEFTQNKLPSPAVLEERSHGCVVLFEQGNIVHTLVGRNIPELQSLLSQKKHSDVVQGQSAFAGKVKGTVRVIFDPSKVPIFNPGDILVSPWTRPEYLPIMKKAAAFVTDGGGILSHAAIVARELRKPCVIGTKNATKIFKDGDKVEVDAEKGVVKKL